MEDWLEAALEVADSEGMPDSTVIPTWPKECESFPALTVGAVRKQVARLEAAEKMAKAIDATLRESLLYRVAGWEALQAGLLAWEAAK